MVYLLPLAFVTVAAVEASGDACQACLFGEWAEGFALGGVVEVAHHDDVWYSALTSDGVYGLA